MWLIILPLSIVAKVIYFGEFAHAINLPHLKLPPIDCTILVDDGSLSIRDAVL